MTLTATAYRELTARSFGPCGRNCGHPVEPGERIANTGLTAGKPWAHVECPAGAPKPPKPQSGTDISNLDGAYAVPNGQGGLTFIKVDRVAEGKWAGWSFVRQQTGPNETRIGSQRPGQTYSGAWGGLLAKIAEDPKTAMERYGQELGYCGACGLELTNEESRALGIGPICRAKMGW
jgi:hypothetical protein